MPSPAVEKDISLQAYCPDCQDFESCGKKRYKEAEYHHPCYYFYPPKSLYGKYKIKETGR